jgi:hypothetical protein
MDDAALLTERQKLLLARARVQLKHLQFDLERNPIKERQVLHMLEIYNLEGCQRLVPENFIPAIISKKDFDQALTQSKFSQTDPTSIPELVLPINFKLLCLHGKHRIFAAQEFLEPGNQWWTVDIYSSGCFPDTYGITYPNTCYRDFSQVA